MPATITMPVLVIVGWWPFDFFFSLVTLCAFIGMGIGMVVRVVSRS